MSSLSARDRIVLIVVIAVAAVAGAWMLVIQPKRAQASKLASQISSEQTQLDTARSQVDAGVAARNQFASDYTELVRLGEAVPSDDDIPSLIYQIQGAANQAKVSFRGLQVAASSGSSGGSSSSSASATLPPGVGMGPAGLPTEQFTFTLQGSFFNLSSFFNRLQRFVVAGKNELSISGRLMSINSITFGSGPSGFPQISATISATTYLDQASQGLTAGATSAGPAGASTTPGSSSSSSTPAAAAAVTPVIR